MGGTSGPVADSAPNGKKSHTLSKESEKAHRSMSVLGLGLVHVPDCALLAHEQAKVAELYTAKPSICLKVMENFLDSTPQTLGFVLYQQMVRRYSGIAQARAVFSRARRVLQESKGDQKPQRHMGGGINSSNEGETQGDTAAAGSKEDVDADAVNGPNKDKDASEIEENGMRWMVTNRLDPSVGRRSAGATSGVPNASVHAAGGSSPAEGPENNGGPSDKVQRRARPGPITWHLYASHATMEHRLNNSPEIAARVYELGLRKHVSFLTKPPYVMRYAQLLLELGDTVNLRALLTRAVAACEELASKAAATSQEGGASKIQHQQLQGSTSAAVAALWDMTLRFESLLTGADPANVSAMVLVEKRRRIALLGPDVEDVSTGSVNGVGDAVSIGAQKSTIADQLIRWDG